MGNNAEWFERCFYVLPDLHLNYLQPGKGREDYTQHSIVSEANHIWYSLFDL